MMNADQLRARADFYRETAVRAEMDQDFELNLELAGMFDRIADEASCRGETRGREPRRDRSFLDQLRRFVRPRSHLLAVGCATACMALGACQTTAERVSDKEDLLAAAGFTVRPANTPQRLSAMRQLPANKFVQKINGDQVEYVYADPIVCNCLYVGDQKAYGAYRQEVFTRNIVNEQQLNAEIYQDNWEWGGWDWGPWGPGPGW